MQLLRLAANAFVPQFSFKLSHTAVVLYQLRSTEHTHATDIKLFKDNSCMMWHVSVQKLTCRPAAGEEHASGAAAASFRWQILILHTPLHHLQQSGTDFNCLQ